MLTFAAQDDLCYQYPVQKASIKNGVLRAGRWGVRICAALFILELIMGRCLALRYAIWSNLAAQAEVARELTAMLVYPLRGWI